MNRAELVEPQHSKAQDGEEPCCSGAPSVRPAVPHKIMRAELVEPQYSKAQGGEEPSGAKRLYARSERKRTERL